MLKPKDKYGGFGNWLDVFLNSVTISFIWNNDLFGKITLAMRFCPPSHLWPNFKGIKALKVNASTFFVKANLGTIEVYSSITDHLMYLDIIF